VRALFLKRIAMLSNYYPIHVKPTSADRLSRLKQSIIHFSQIYSRSAKRQNKQKVNTRHNRLGQWAEQFNHQLATNNVIITTNTNEISVQQFGTLGQIRLYGDLGILQGGDISVYFYTDNWRSIDFHQHLTSNTLTCFDDGHDQAWCLSCSQLDPELRSNNLNLSLPEPQIPIQASLSAQVEINELRQMWASLTHVHQFYDMLSLFKLDLLEAITLMQGQWTHPITSGQLINFLQQCFEQKLDCKILTGNRGIVHELIAPIKQLKCTPKALNISGNNYHCNVNLLSIEQVWLVKRATKYGIVHSLEAFDSHGRLILQVQEQKPSEQPESSLWIHCLERQEIITI
jgi:putative heme degradation protein